MKKYLTEYIKYVERMLSEGGCDYAELKEKMLVQIGFMQHERLIHLIVTALFAVMLIMSILGTVLAPSVGMIALAAMFLIMMIPYTWHYYFLENNVQKLYGYYNRVSELADRAAQTAESIEGAEISREQ